MNGTGLAKAVLAGAAAGVVGTLSMDLLWFDRSRREGSDASFAEWESSGDIDSFDEAGAPAKVGRRVADAVGVDIPESGAGITTDVVHWVTGSGWAIGASLLATFTRLNPVAAGVGAGVAAFGAAYTVLPVLGLYDPIWAYDGKTLWRDATAHATFGAATGVTLAGLALVDAAVRRGRATPIGVAGRRLGHRRH